MKAGFPRSHVLCKEAVDQYVKTNKPERKKKKISETGLYLEVSNILW